MAEGDRKGEPHAGQLCFRYSRTQFVLILLYRLMVLVSGPWMPPNPVLPEHCSSRIKTGSSVACDKASSTRTPVCRHGGGVPSGAVAHSDPDIHGNKGSPLPRPNNPIQMPWLIVETTFKPKLEPDHDLDCPCLHRPSCLSDLPIIDPRHRTRSEDVSAPPARNWLTFALRPGTWKEMRRFHYEVPLGFPNSNMA